jgi:glycerophosphoryl diester phosphodiesterase
MKVTLARDTRIAHRGASEFYPENTLEAFEGAHRLGAQWVETDVMLTQDGMPVLFHDDTLERFTGEKKHIATMQYEDLKRVDVGSWFDPKFKGACVPTLAQGLDSLNRLGMSLNLELKPTLGQDKATAIGAVKVLRESAFPKDRLIISSFSLLALEEAYKIAPEYAYGWLADEPRDLLVGLKSPIPWNSIHINNDWATPENVQDLRNGDFQVLVFTVNDPKRAKFLFDNGVAGVFSDDPTPSPKPKLSKL